MARPTSIVASTEVPVEEERRGERFCIRRRRLGAAAGGEKLGCSLFELPPGTGDIQLTIAQQVSVAGAVVVTTPQDVALSDAIKAKTMFDKVNIPVLGFVENMSGFVCPHCHQETDIFSKGGAEQAAGKLGVPFLGRVPINPAIRIGSDDGRPVVAADPGLPEAQALTRIAQNIADRVAIANMTAVPRGQKPLVQLGKKP